MMRGQRTRAALISIASNAALIVLKLVAGVITGSVAIITEAIHSAVDLVASFIAYFSVRQAEEPADADHPHGHEKFENVAAAAEGVLILDRLGRDHLRRDPQPRAWAPSCTVARRRHRRPRLLDRRQPRRLDVAVPAARETQSAALEGDAAHLRTDAYTSAGVLVGLALVQITGAEWLDPVVALVIAGAIVVTGLRIVVRSWGVLVDEALPGHRARGDPRDDRGLRRPRRGRLPPAAHPPRRRPPLRRPARAVRARAPRSRTPTGPRTRCRTRSRGGCRAAPTC